jgi:hypothetical protein
MDELLAALTARGVNADLARRFLDMTLADVLATLTVSELLTLGM